MWCITEWAKRNTCAVSSANPSVAFIFTAAKWGGGFLVQHGFATIINAERIGRNFKVFQQVTVGYNGDQRPVLGDDVEVCCGAKVIGGIKVGNRVTIGAQALVIRDVEDDVVVGGVPAKVIKRK